MATMWVVTEVERVLGEAGIAFRRDYDWNDGWNFEVEGNVVARGGSLGLLADEVSDWWAGHGRALVQARRSEAPPASAHAPSAPEPGC